MLRRKARYPRSREDTGRIGSLLNRGSRGDTCRPQTDTQTKTQSIPNRYSCNQLPSSTPCLWFAIFRPTLEFLCTNHLKAANISRFCIFIFSAHMNYFKISPIQTHEFHPGFIENSPQTPGAQAAPNQARGLKAAPFRGAVRLGSLAVPEQPISLHGFDASLRFWVQGVESKPGLHTKAESRGPQPFRGQETSGQNQTLIDVDTGRCSPVEIIFPVRFRPT